MRHQTRRRSKLLLGVLAAILVPALTFTCLALAHGTGWNHDDDPAGTIASFDRDTGKLTIDLGDGGSISGTVTRWTWIDDGEECDDASLRRHHWDCEEARSSDAGTRGYRHRLWDDDHHGRRHHGGDLDDLVVGAVVEDSLMILKDGRAFYAKIDLED